MEILHVEFTLPTSVQLPFFIFWKAKETLLLCFPLVFPQFIAEHQFLSYKHIALY